MCTCFVSLAVFFFLTINFWVDFSLVVLIALSQLTNVSWVTIEIFVHSNWVNFFYLLLLFHSHISFKWKRILSHLQFFCFFFLLFSSNFHLSVTSRYLFSILFAFIKWSLLQKKKKRFFSDSIWFEFIFLSIKSINRFSKYVYVCITPCTMHIVHNRWSTNIYTHILNSIFDFVMSTIELNKM